MAHQDVYQLGKFIKARSPKPTSERSDTWIGFDLEYRPVHLIKRFKLGPAHLGVVRHRTKFIHNERLSVLARAMLSENHRPWRSNTDDQSSDSHRNRHDQESNKSPYPIDDSLDQQRPGNFRSGTKYQHRPATQR